MFFSCYDGRLLLFFFLCYWSRFILNLFFNFLCPWFYYISWNWKGITDLLPVWVSLFVSNFFSLPLYLFKNISFLVFEFNLLLFLGLGLFKIFLEFKLEDLIFLRLISFYFWYHFLNFLFLLFCFDVFYNLILLLWIIIINTNLSIFKTFNLIYYLILVCVVI